MSSICPCGSQLNRQGTFCGHAHQPALRRIVVETVAEERSMTLQIV